MLTPETRARSWCSFLRGSAQNTCRNSDVVLLHHFIPNYFVDASTLFIYTCLRNICLMDNSSALACVREVRGNRRTRRNPQGHGERTWRTWSTSWGPNSGSCSRNKCIKTKLCNKASILYHSDEYSLLFGHEGALVMFSLHRFAQKLCNEAGLGVAMVTLSRYLALSFFFKQNKNECIKQGAEKGIKWKQSCQIMWIIYGLIRVQPTSVTC